MAPPGKPPAPSLQSLRRPMGYLRAHKGAVALALVSVFAVMGANLSVPLLVRMAIDDGVGHSDRYVLGFAIGLLLAAAVARGVFGFAQDYLSSRTSQHVAYAMREDLFGKIQRLSFSYYDKTET